MSDRFPADSCLHTLRSSHLIQSATRIDIDSHILRVTLEDMSTLNYLRQSELPSARHTGASLLDGAKTKCLGPILRSVVCFKSCDCGNLLTCKISDSEGEDTPATASPGSPPAVQFPPSTLATTLPSTSDWRLRSTPN